MKHETDRQDHADTLSPACGPSAKADPDPRRRKREQEPTMGKTLETLTFEETSQLLQDLKVHQMELEMQNQELRRTQEALEISRARYFDLYDLAPVGYLTLTEKGMIREANLAAASLLGLPRGALINRPLSGFILPEDQNLFYGCRRQVFATGDFDSCELRLRREGGALFPAHLEFAMGQDRESGGRYCFVILSDLSERKRAEEARLAETAQREENRAQGPLSRHART